MRTKAQLISDVFSFSQSTLVDVKTAFDLSRFLSYEFDYLPWNVFISRINFYTDIIDSTQLNGLLQSYLSNLVEPYYKFLGWNEIKSRNWLDRFLEITFLL